MEVLCIANLTSARRLCKSVTVEESGKLALPALASTYHTLEVGRGWNRPELVVKNLETWLLCFGESLRNGKSVGE